MHGETHALPADGLHLKYVLWHHVDNSGITVMRNLSLTSQLLCSNLLYFTIVDFVYNPACSVANVETPQLNVALCYDCGQLCESNDCFGR